jgi:uncharacterized protein (DUF2336 family)
MGAALSLLPELEDVILHGSGQKRAEALRRITSLFLAGADQFSDQHVDLFDNVFGLLIEEIETKVRAEVSARLAPVQNAPVNVLRALAKDDNIAVAGPVLQLALRLDEADLVDIAKSKGQAHLHAISARKELGEAVTDVLVRRGDGDVVRRVAANRGARISNAGFQKLLKRAQDDCILAEKVGFRPDIPETMFRELLTQATAVVRNRLFAAAPPEIKTQIKKVLTKVSDEISASIAAPRDYSAAEREVKNLNRGGRLDETALTAFAKAGKFEEAVVALATLSELPVGLIDRIMTSERRDPVLLLCKASDMKWATVKAILMLPSDSKKPPMQRFEKPQSNYARLSVPIAQRVVRFWRLKAVDPTELS